MSYCHVANQIAKHCDEPEQEILVCWACEQTVKQDELTEVETKRNGFQFICGDCIEDYITEGV